MTYYVIVRSFYYGQKVGPWHLQLDETGEPLTFRSRREAIAAINPDGFNQNEYACEFKVLGDGNAEATRVERRRNGNSRNRQPVPSSERPCLPAPVSNQSAK